MLAWLRRQFGWTRRVRVRVADVGPDARALRRLIMGWLPDGPDLRPQVQIGRVEIVVRHHVRLFGDHGPVAAAVTERADGLTRVVLGRCWPSPGGAWQSYAPAELLSALDLHLTALARGYAMPQCWFPGTPTLVPSSATHRPGLPAPAPELGASLVSASDDPPERAAAPPAEDDDLPPAYGEVLILRYWRGHSVAEIAACLTARRDQAVIQGRPPGPPITTACVKWRLVEARRRFARQFCVA